MFPVFFCIAAFYKHVGTMGKRNTDDSIDMMHIYASDIVSWIGVVKKRKVSKASFFKSESSLDFFVRVFLFYRLISPFFCYEEGMRGYGGWDAMRRCIPCNFWKGFFDLYM